jgi:predicted TIM-barrel fold metal-dependent hydrolase
MTESIFDRVRPIDTDTHVTEPADLWTSRVASKWGDAVPHVKRVEGRDFWFIRDQMVSGPGFTSAAGFDGSFPEARMGFDDIPKSTYDAKARIEHMDAEGIHAQVLYPNVGGFGSGGFLKLEEPKLMMECVRAYNDFLVEWSAEGDANRLVPVAAMPFWDVSLAVAEVERAARIGHRSILACSEPQTFGQPRLCSPYWDPFWAAVRDVDLPVSFHIGAGDLTDLFDDTAGIGVKANFSRVSSTIFMQNANCIADLIFGGVCHRFPELKLVSVESGIGWIPSFLEACDWQFSNGQVRREQPDYLLPSEYFRRQIYACFWFEEKSIGPALDLYPDNILWETDFPHPTCQHPGPANGFSQHPRAYIDSAFGDVDETTIRKVLHDNAASLYRVD